MLHEPTCRSNCTPNLVETEHVRRKLIIQVVTHNSDEPSVLTPELASTSTLADLKNFLIGSADLPPGYPDHTWILQRNGSQVAIADDEALSKAGVQDGDMLLAEARPGTSQPRERAPNNQTLRDPTEIENLRMHILQHRPTRALVEARTGRDLLQDGETLDDVLNDPPKFRERWQTMTERQIAEAEKRSREQEKLDENINEENQQKIYHEIQQERVAREASQIMEENPEFFASVTMLYIAVEVNGRPVKAFVDSGAQMTVISPQKAQECNLTENIDERYSGIARGVGTARILGRIHRTGLTVHASNGYIDTLPCSLTVMEGKGVDMLLGLDMLKRYQASIDLEKNCLRLTNGAELPFLPEGEIPKNEFDGDGNATAGAPSTATNTPASNAAGATGAPQQATGSFSGAGRTLGSVPGPSSVGLSATAGRSGASSAPLSSPPGPSTSAAQSTPQGQQQAANPRNRQAQPTQQTFSERDINFLVQNGAGSPERARQLLTASGGNLDMAMSILFDM